VLPQGFAFATLAGLPPEYGLYTAIVPCIVAALFGSSWHVVSGPTNANSLALFAVLAPLAAVGSPPYIQLALAVTVLVGVMQWLIGALRLGAVANFISPSALHGFTSGAAALIALHALTDLIGVAAPPRTAPRRCSRTSRGRSGRRCRQRSRSPAHDRGRARGAAPAAALAGDADRPGRRDRAGALLNRGALGRAGAGRR
jgi:hypothetical protein